MQENKIKAGLIYNFLKYTEWPHDSLGTEDQKINVCLMGGDAFGGALDSLNGRTAQKSKIHVRELHDIAEAADCHLVFIHKDLAETAPAYIKGLEGKGILTVSDIKGFALMGGMAEFFTKDDQRIHLRINSIAIKKGGLTIGDTLLRLSEGAH